MSSSHQLPARCRRELQKADVRKDATTLNQIVELISNVPSRAHRTLRERWLLRALCLVVLFAPNIQAQIRHIDSDPTQPIQVWSQQASRWKDGGQDVWHLVGDCVIRQGSTLARSNEAILWVQAGDPLSGKPHQVICYLEGRNNQRSVRVEFSSGLKQPNVLTDRSWYGRFESHRGIQMNVPKTTGPPNSPPGILDRATRVAAAYKQPLIQAQFQQEVLPPVQPPTTSVRRIRVLPRGSVRVQVKTFNRPERSEKILVIDSGVKVVVEGAAVGRFGNVGTIVVEADRIVIWTSGLDEHNLSEDTIQSGETPLEFYMEGNIVFSQGERVIYAERMFYNVTRHFGTILNAEMLTDVENYQGLVRVKADVLQQLDDQNFIAYGGAFTSSRMGVPKYWFQSETIEFQDIQSPKIDPFTGQPVFNPQTGEADVNHDMRLTARNIFGYAGGFPVLYAHRLATNLEDPVQLVKRAMVRNDSIFGTQVLIDWNLYHLLGIANPPEGTEWTYQSNLMSERGNFFSDFSGAGFGTEFLYNRNSIFGIQGQANGRIHAFGIKDRGLDVLGFDRRAITPEELYRGRFLLQHRQRLAIGPQVTAEVGWISDRTFLEQYFEREWDLKKDQTTGLEVKQLWEDHSLNLTVDGRLNDFLTQTEWLPRLDHFVLGRSLLFGRATWYGHSHVGYGRVRVADAPTEPTLATQFQLLPWETADGVTPADRQGVRVGTRQEIDVPFDLGPLRVVPYALGDVTHWQEDLNGNDVTRAYGQAGVRTSIPIWRVDPSVQSLLLNLNGLAHKVVFDAEYFWSDANRDLNRFTLYDQLDDDAQEYFRRRFVPVGPFQTGIPTRFDERFFAFRSGMQSNVTAPSAEIADDLMIARFGVRQRWQTKRGLPGQERIVDVVSLDVEGSVFPRAARDNFGEDIGMVNYDFRWHIGDRVTLLSDGYLDFFSQGMRTASIGGRVSRPEAGSLYVGFRTIEGPISSNLLVASLSYRMSEKWITTAGTAYDFGPTGSIGQTFGFTRIGESFLIQLKVNSDISRGNFGVGFMIEPRFLPLGRLGNIGGVNVPPAGARGLE